MRQHRQWTVTALKEVRGSIVDLPTPFENGRVDVHAAGNIIARQIERGTSGIVVCGGVGEAALLTPAEHRLMVETCVSAAAYRIPVIAGVGVCGTADAVAASVAAVNAGADALLCTAPYHLLATQNDITRHVQMIHDAVDAPIIVHDGAPGIGLEIEAIVTLSRLPRVAGLCDGNGNTLRLREVRRRLGDRFLLLTGNDTRQRGYRMAGGHGCVSVSANIAPALCAALHRAWESGDAALSARVSQPLSSLHGAMAAGPAPVKSALYQLGFLNDELRLPLTPLGFPHDRSIALLLREIIPREEKVADAYKRLQAPPVSQQLAQA